MLINQGCETAGLLRATLSVAFLLPIFFLPSSCSANLLAFLSLRYFFFSFFYKEKKKLPGAFVLFVFSVAGCLALICFRGRYF